MRNLDEIIHTVNSIYSKGETTMLTLKDEKRGFIRVNAAAEKMVYSFERHFCNVSHDLHFTAGSTPVYHDVFSAKGHVHICHQYPVSVTGQMHSLNYLPAFKFNTCIREYVEEFFVWKYSRTCYCGKCSTTMKNNHWLIFANEKILLLHLIHRSNKTSYLPMHHDYLNCPLPEY